MATANPGQSYYSDDNGLTWQDITNFDSTANICFKAFTVLIHPVAGFSANVISGHAPLTVEFTDNSTGFPTDWNWSFGDGSFSSAQNPTHTFSSGGAYTIILNVTNAAGSNSLIRSGYIVVNGTNIGIFRPSTGNWYLDYNTTGVVDKTFHFGTTGDIPVIGDWNSDGTADIRSIPSVNRELVPGLQHNRCSE